MGVGVRKKTNTIINLQFARGFHETALALVHNISLNSCTSMSLFVNCERDRDRGVCGRREGGGTDEQTDREKDEACVFCQTHESAEPSFAGNPLSRLRAFESDTRLNKCKKQTTDLFLESRCKPTLR